MTDSTPDVLICGAGIAGAYHLSVKRGIKKVMLIDERPPLSLTSDKSTECYRNWWRGASVQSVPGQFHNEFGGPVSDPRRASSGIGKSCKPLTDARH